MRADARRRRRSSTMRCRSQRVTTPASAPVGVDDRIEPLRSADGIDAQRCAPASRAARRARQRDDVGAHHLAHEQDLQRIDGVLAAQVVAAPATFSVRIERRSTSTVKRVRDRDRDQQRQQHVDVVRQLEREDDAGERRAHRAAEDRAHADQRPEAGALAGQEPAPRGRRARRPSSAAAPARRPRCPSRARPPRSIDLTIRMPRISCRRHVALQQRADRVVADAERLRERPGRRCRSTRPPIAGHHIQWIGSCWKASSAA